MLNRPVTWSVFCKNPSKPSILVSQRWAATQVVAVVVAVMAVVVVTVVAVVVDLLPAIPLHLAEAGGNEFTRRDPETDYVLDDWHFRSYYIVHMFPFGRRTIT